MAVIHSTFITILVVISFCGLIAARSKFGAYFPRHSELAFDDMLSEEDVFNDIRLPEAEANLLAKWPYLRELVASSPVEIVSDNEEMFPNLRNQLEQHQSLLQQEQSQQLQQSQQKQQPLVQHRFRPVSFEEKFIVPEPLPTPIPYQLRNSISEKRNNNNHYMALCHFKICNMGRKRNTRFLHL